MPRYAAFLRGVSPQNCSMSQLRACFEAAGFGNVRTLLSSGNVVFDARDGDAARLQRRAEQAMADGLPRPFNAVVRAIADLERLFEPDPWAGYRLPAEAKKIVTFLRSPATDLPALPIERDGAYILHSAGGAAFGAYVPGPDDPAVMRLLEKTFGKDITTRTLATVRKCMAA